MRFLTALLLALGFLAAGTDSVQSAACTWFHRGEVSFEPVGPYECAEFHDPDIDDIAQRVVCSAEEMVPGPLVANGRELAVARDHRRTNSGAELQPSYFQASVGSRSGTRSYPEGMRQLPAISVAVVMGLCATIADEAKHLWFVAGLEGPGRWL